MPTAEANIGELCPAGEVRLGGGGERRCRAPYLVYGLTVLNALSSAESERESSRSVTLAARRLGDSRAGITGPGAQGRVRLEGLHVPANAAGVPA